MIDNKAKDQIEEIIISKGHNLYGIDYFREDGENIMQINIINRLNPLNLDECIKLTKLINPILENYELSDIDRIEVGSAGIERRIKDKKQWNFNIGENVKIKLDKKSIKAKLISVENDYVLVNENGKEQKINYEDIIKARTYFV